MLFFRGVQESRSQADGNMNQPPTPMYLCTTWTSTQADDAAATSTADEMAGDSSIIKYEDPILARPNVAFDMTMGHDSLPQYVSLYASNERRPADAPLRVTGAGAAASGIPRNTRRLQGGGDDNTAVLKAILPNKEYVDEAGAWVQAVSSHHLTLLREPAWLDSSGSSSGMWRY